jgi:1-deoxy-D-xylulose-5-phosphate reductoisomerase
LDFEKLGSLRFLPLVREDFPCYDLALSAGEAGDNYPCALNAAGEEAVQAFLQNRISFLAIADTIKEVLQSTQRKKADEYGVLVETDAFARAYAREYIKKTESHI